ncbi:cob(I)yrinic acid a,c-diamide adenosyltransferase [Desulfofustis glycolicus]|uniref:corrinoid adenosyltransferase n=1 Tax=Desulfofustis glycolicus DSM 9705 TaxID=1121409 RepID=A0A1M5V6T9_9BACT|nr:cob(I)yrinic acid a,c-diamide adenosyltransferase [Desulfofustis glycolicus]MCB2214947.1 cob(I)yrinic acid a,c-diamide adenosyltransferase [Desulfobulbaceae bacterium]SHH70936.1 cob(I)yrinic acid a,c-diamide adenosyltransferase [Desulfofustis glycolicus DSM 9705]
MEITKLTPKQRRGLVVVLTGYGKGKTTSAMGMVLRAVGHGMRVCVIQFMKGDLYTGEWDGVKLLGDQVELHVTGKGFCGIQGNPFPHAEHRRNAQDAIDLALAKMKSNRFDLLVLDEINNAVHLRLVDSDQVLTLLAQRPERLHLVLTGRDAHDDVVAQADTVSRVDEIKHAYRRDIEPQPGIDY